MNPLTIIEKYYKKNSDIYNTLVAHSQAVADKALEIAEIVKELNPNLEFIREASMLHDIGIYKTNAPDIGCFGDLPYICHGYLGCEILEKENLPMHALVCERHVGVGLSLQDIIKKNLPIPKRDMVPVTLEEEIVCLADKFFSKTEKNLTKAKSIDEIRKEFFKFGQDKVKKFDDMCAKFWVKK